MSLQKLAHISASRENLMNVATCFFVFFFFFSHTQCNTYAPNKLGVWMRAWIPVPAGSTPRGCNLWPWPGIAIRHINGQSRQNPRLKMAKRPGRRLVRLLFFVANYL